MKLDTAQLVTPDMEHIENVFKQSGYEIRIVGGAVRDLLLGKDPKDIDFATDATPSEMKAIFDQAGLSWIPTGEQHGTLTVLGQETREPFEITTLRIDTDTDGRHADVEFTRSWEKDAERRDLTYNALSMDMDGTVYDYHNGIEDLKQSVTKFVGDADKRIQEDYLRILRFFRFQGRTDTPSFDTNTMTAIRNNAKGLAQISGERIFMELSKILTGNHVIELLRKMRMTGVDKYITLNLDSISELERVIPLSDTLAIRLAALLKTEKDVEALQKAWKFDNALRLQLSFLVKNRNKALTQDNVQRALSNPKHNRELLMLLLAYQGQQDLVDTLTDWKSPKFPISGQDLIDVGIKPGPDMGQILTNLRIEWERSNFEASKLDLLRMLKSDKYTKEDIDLSEKFEFITTELMEARLFRNERALKGKSAQELAEVLMADVMVLQIMRYEDPAWAEEYARRTMQHGNFDGLRMASTDLHNLLSIIEHQERFSDKFQPDSTIMIPTLHLKRFLRDTIAGRKNTASDRQFFMKLERSLKVKSSYLRAIRRIAGDWPRALPNEKKTAASRLILQLRNGYVLMDMFKPFDSMVKRKKLLAPGMAKKKGIPLAAKVGAAAVAGYALARKMK